MKHRILFVDDEPSVLHGLERSLHSHNEEWDMKFAGDAVEALAELGAAPFDIVVSDLRMPGMDGTRLLTRVKEVAADAIRIMLTGQADLPAAMLAVNQAEVFRLLLKPVQPDQIVAALKAGLRQQELMRTERQLIELQLEHAQKMGLIGECAASLVHEFKNILAVIVGFTDLALEDINDSAERSKSLQHVRTTAENGRLLTRQILDFCRQEDESQFRLLDLSDWLGRTVPLLGPLLGRCHKLDCNSAAGSSPISGNPAMLSQVLLNLAINACDAMPDGGRLILQVEPAPTASVARRGGGRFVRLSVSDTGCGMDEATRSRLFQPFFTTKIKGTGTGLGLATVRRIIERHGGWIDVASQIGVGTTFYVYLPCANEAAGCINTQPEAA